MESPKLDKRFVGAVVGFAVGDALGMPVQFLTREQILHHHGNPIVSYHQAHSGHSSDFLAKGSYTDDTQLMLATAECLIECGDVNPAEQADALVRWYRNTPSHRTPMRAYLRACKHLSIGRPWNKSGVFSSCCGGAIRMVPIGLLMHKKPDQLIRSALDVCLITHTEPRALAASAAVAYLVARLVQASDRCLPGDQVLETADRVASLDNDFASMLRWVTQMVHLPPEEALFEIGTSLDAMEAVPAATYCLLRYPRNFCAAVLAAVNAGDASDSVGALTGSFVGALTGIDAIPREWQNDLEDHDLLAGVARSLVRISGQDSQ